MRRTVGARASPPRAESVAHFVAFFGICRRCGPGIAPPTLACPVCSCCVCVCGTDDGAAADAGSAAAGRPAVAVRPRRLRSSPRRAARPVRIVSEFSDVLFDVRIVPDGRVCVGENRTFSGGAVARRAGTDGGCAGNRLRARHTGALDSPARAESDARLFIFVHICSHLFTFLGMYLHRATPPMAPRPDSVEWLLSAPAAVAGGGGHR